ncbi:MAG: hypothetical protein Q3M30_15620 [Candidatus Electrothrix sp. Rat3]|nr:hypothetical protein [Candidatus Electrothrix rattekaaiensis]
MDTLILLKNLPITIDELLGLAKMMRSHDILTASFDMEQEDPYVPETYRLQKAVHDTKTILVADRNLMTRWVNLVKSCRITEKHRVAAATLAFCQCSGILIDPAIALYELAATSGNEKAIAEENIFRLVDNTNPRVLTDIALGYHEGSPSFLTEQGHNFKKKQIDFCVSLQDWQRIYVVVLKIAALSLRGGKSHKVVIDLFDWMYSDYLFLATATMLGLCYFSPNSPKKGLLKQLRSNDRELALAGIRNATWDMTLIHKWLQMARRQPENNTLNLLGSFDKKMHAIVRNILVFPNSDEASEAKWHDILLEFWKSDKGAYLYRKTRKYFRDAENPSRLCNKNDTQFSFDKLISDGERAIREWHP